MPLQNWIEKARDLLSATWRSQGAPESDEVATQDFLQQLSIEFAARVEGDGGRAVWPSAPQPTDVITLDEEGFDCRVGKRARKRRREARKTVDLKQKPSDTKGGGAPCLHCH